MWIILIGASESIVKRAPKSAKLIDIRQGKAAILQQQDYVQANLPDMTQDSILAFLAQYCPELPIRLFVTFTERHLRLAATLNEQHSCVGNTVDCVAAFCNKALMREKIATAPDCQPVWHRLVQTDQLKAALQAADFELILKPVDGSGSTLIHRYTPLVTDIDTLVAAYQHLEVVLLEAAIQGQEFSVEALSQNHQHTILGITAKTTDANFIETGHTSPANIHPDLAVRIQLATQAFLIIMGLREGPSHTELIANDNGIYIVEGHPRTGGDRIVSLVRLTTGVDLIAAYLHQLADVPYQAQAIKAPVAQTVFIRYPSGATYNGINSLAAYRHGLEELEVNLQLGQLIEAPTHSGNRHALAVIHAANHALCNELALQIQNTLVAQHASH